MTPTIDEQIDDQVVERVTLMRLAENVNDCRETANNASDPRVVHGTPGSDSEPAGAYWHLQQALQQILRALAPAGLDPDGYAERVYEALIVDGLRTVADAVRSERATRHLNTEVVGCYDTVEVDGPSDLTGYRAQCSGCGWAGEPHQADPAEVTSRHCEGHETLRGDMMGADFYCDGSCRPGAAFEAAFEAAQADADQHQHQQDAR